MVKSHGEELDGEIFLAKNHIDELNGENYISALTYNISCTKLLCWIKAVYKPGKYGISSKTYFWEHF